MYQDEAIALLQPPPVPVLLTGTANARQEAEISDPRQNSPKALISHSDKDIPAARHTRAGDVQRRFPCLQAAYPHPALDRVK